MRKVVRPPLAEINALLENFNANKIATSDSGVNDRFTASNAISFNPYGHPAQSHYEFPFCTTRLPRRRRRLLTNHPRTTVINGNFIQRAKIQMKVREFPEI